MLRTFQISHNQITIRYTLHILNDQITKQTNVNDF